MASGAAVLKEGYLKKQGGRMRTWKNRYFVLSENGIMVYYNGIEKNKKINEFSLKGTELCVIPIDPYDTNGVKYTFEIRCGEKGSRLTENHEIFLLWAASEKERDEWVFVLKKILYRHLGGAVFGYPLEEIMAVDGSKGYIVPRLVKELVEFIEPNLETEGIFRLAGRQKLIHQLIDEYDRGTEVDLAEKNVDVHTAASVLKTYLRQLPEPLIPFSRFESMSTYGSKFSIQLADMSAVHQLVINGLQSLPPWNYNLLKYIIHFLHQVSSFSSVNKMTVSNLSAIHAPNILRMEDNTPELLATVNMVITDTTMALINNYELLFARDYFVPEMQPPVEKSPSMDLLVPPPLGSEHSSGSETPIEAATNMPTRDYYAQMNDQLKGILHEEQSRRQKLEEELKCAKAKIEDLVARVRDLEGENGKLQRRLSDVRLKHGALA